MKCLCLSVSAWTDGGLIGQQIMLELEFIPGKMLVNIQ